MKRLLLLLFLFPFQVFCQGDIMPRNAEGKYEYQGDVKVLYAPADLLYNNAKKFIVVAFKSRKDFTQLNDNFNKTVIGKGTMTILFKGLKTSGFSTYVRYTISIACKDDHYKYSIKDFLFYDRPQISGTVAMEDESYWVKDKAHNKQWPYIKQQIAADVASEISLMKKTMANLGSDK
jgi:Domain of unknown function (DUF4468) with TBP-like fold